MKQKNHNDSAQLSLGSSEQVIARNALFIIRTHKKSCKKLLACCDNITSLTPEIIEFLKEAEKQTINAIEDDLNKINFVYYRYSKCLYRFIDIIQSKVAKKIKTHGKLSIFLNTQITKNDLLITTNAFRVRATIANHYSPL